MENMSSKFGIPQSVLDAVSKIQKEETEYQAKVKAHMAKKGIKSLGELTPEEKKKFFKELDAMHQAKNEEAKDGNASKKKEDEFHTKLDKLVHKTFGHSSDEKKMKKEEVDFVIESYDIYHKDFSTAVQHAWKAVEKRGFQIDKDDWDRKVAMGPRKPSEGKTNSYSITLLDKNGKPVRKALQMQVYNKGGRNPYELNMYVESVELEEGAVEKKEKTITMRHKTSGKEVVINSKAKEQYQKMGFVPIKEENELKSYIVKMEKDGRSIVRNYSAKSELDARSKAKVDAARTQMKVASVRLREHYKFSEDNQETQIEEELSKSQLERMRAEYSKIDRIDPASDNYKRVIKMLDSMDLDTLQDVADANIKFISMLAKNRIARKKMKKESYEMIDESHYKVGDRVRCLASGMKGTVVKVDPEGEGKYYTVKQDSGKTMKYAPDELKALNEEWKKMRKEEDEKEDDEEKMKGKKKEEDEEEDEEEDDEEEDDEDEMKNKKKKNGKEVNEAKMKKKEDEEEDDGDDEKMKARQKLSGKKEKVEVNPGLKDTN